MGVGDFLILVLNFLSLSTATSVSFYFYFVLPFIVEICVSRKRLKKGGIKLEKVML